MENSTKKILIVDDVPENIEVLGSILHPEYEVQFALSGAKAFELLASGELPDIILLDIMMPEMDGYEVCRKLKADPRTRNIPVMFVTAKNDEFDEAMGFEVGAIDYLTKPIKPLVVKSRLKTHLELVRQKQELAKKHELTLEHLRLREDIDRMMKHDLKTPLAAVLAVPDLMAEDKNLTPEQREILELVSQSGKRMRDMINNSLDLFKMEQGKYPLQPVFVNIVTIVQQVFKALNTLASNKNVSLQLFDDKGPREFQAPFWLVGEEPLFYSLLANLTKNAVEASPPQGVVSITLTANPAEIVIRNRGVIPTEIRSQFMNRYVTHGKIGGSGLGAYSARLMAVTMGGRISFNSSEEDGTAISITFPDLQVRPEVLTAEKKRDFPVLLALESGHLRALTRSLLSRQGFFHLDSTTSPEAIQNFFRVHQCGLALIGEEFLPHLESRNGKNDPAPNTPIHQGAKCSIIVITHSHHSSQLLNRSFPVPIRVLPQPFSSELFTQTLTELYTQQ